MADAVAQIDIIANAEAAAAQIAHVVSELDALSTAGYASAEATKAAAKAAAAAAIENKKWSDSIAQLKSSSGFITSGEYSTEYKRIAQALRETREAGVTSGPVFDSLAKRMKDLGVLARQSGLRGADGFKEIAAAATKAGGAAAGFGAIVRVTGNVGSDALKNVSIEALNAGEKLSGASAAFATIGFKAIEDGIEDVAGGFLKAAAGTGDLTSKITALRAALAGSTLALAAAALAAAAGIYKINELANAWTELGNAERDADEAQARSEEATERQTEQMQKLADALKLPIESLKEFTTGSGAKGFAAIVEHAKADPEGRIGKAFAELAKPARDAAKAGTEFGDALAAMRKKLGDFDIAKMFLGGDALRTVLTETETKLGDQGRAAAVAATEVKGLIAQYERFGMDVPKWLKEADQAAQDHEGLTSLKKEFADLTPEDFSGRAANLLTTFDELKARFGSSAIAGQLLGDKIKALADDGKRLKIDLPAAFDALAHSIVSVNALLEEATRRETAHFEHIRSTNKQVLDQMAADRKAAYDKMIGDAKAFSDTYANVKITSDLTTADDKTVDASKGGGGLTRVLDALKKMSQDGLTLTKGFATSAGSLIKSGNISAVERLSEAVRSQIEALRGLPGLSNLAAMNELQSLSQGLANALQQLRNLAKIPGLAGGGFAMGGSPYLVGERGPELFVPRQSGTVVPNGAGFKMPTAVEIGDAVAQAMTKSKPSMTSLKIDVQVDGKKGSAKVKEDFDRGAFQAW